MSIEITVPVPTIDKTIPHHQQSSHGAYMSATICGQHEKAAVVYPATQSAQKPNLEFVLKNVAIIKLEDTVWSAALDALVSDILLEFNIAQVWVETDTYSGLYADMP